MLLHPQGTQPDHQIDSPVLENQPATLIESPILGSGSVQPLEPLIPFLKWPGGKRWLVANHPGIFPYVFNSYIEPFLGAGSVYFHLQPGTAILGDMNPDVVTAFQGVRNEPIVVQQWLAIHHANHCRDYYYEIRDRCFPKSIAEQAARIIYLNRTCFNGIYRVNRQGVFNVPIGTKKNVILDTDNFPLAAKVLKHTLIIHGDFEPLIDQALEGDLLFLDPPYTVRHNRNGFVKYNEKLFSWDDQVRLAAAATRAATRGAIVVITNAAHSSVQQLYRSDVFQFNIVSRFSGVAASSTSRKQFEELVITSN